MYQASIENSRGETLVLTGNEPKYQLINIEGLNPPQAQVNLTDIAGMDGAKFNSSKLATRNLVLTLKINGDAEMNRLQLYNYFPTKEQVTFYYSNSSRDVQISGYVETCEVNPFSQSEEMQISIICPQPYFRAIEEVVADISNITGQFVFPFSINDGEPIAFSSYVSNQVTNVYNDSDLITGVIIEIDVEADVNQIVIRNTETGDSITLNYEFEADDRITINTNSGEKSLKLLRNGVTTNLFPALQRGSTFLQLMPGDNLLAYSVDSGAGDANVFITFTYFNIFRGV